MATKEEVREKVYLLIDELPERLKKQTDNILESGVIDFESEKDNWALPKDIYIAMLPYIEFLHRHPKPTRAYKKKIKQIRLAISYWLS
jgi:hypothetical protein